MVNGTKEYRIVINGVQESTTQLDNLLKVLDNIEARMSDLGKSGSGAGVSSTMASTSKAADELGKKYEKLNELIGGQRDELMEVNRLIKEATKAREADAAAERLAADNYGNTMAGLKQQLADVKTAMQFAEIGSDEFNTLTNAANELNTKLLEIEKSYGQFGRNVGNYKSAAEGFKGVTVAIGGVERQFKNTTVATRTMEKELQALEIEGKQNTQEYKDLSEAFHQYKLALDKAKASVDDLKASSKGMDKLLDLGQSLGALSQVSNGFSAFFGNDSDIQKSIQSLVGLQNAMKGIETIRKQMNTEEGIGGLFKNGNEAIDKFVNKLFGVKEAASGAAVANESLAVSEGAVATGSKTATVGVQTLSAAQKAATVSAKALGVALKAVAIGLILEAVAQLTEYIKPLTNKIGELRKALGTLALNEVKAAAGMKDMIDADERYESVLKGLNRQLSERLKYINELKNAGKITSEEAYTQELKANAENVSKTLDYLKNTVKDADFKKELNDGMIHPMEIYEKTLDKAFDKSGRNITSFKEKLKDTFNETDGIAKVAQAEVANYLKQVDELIRQYQAGDQTALIRLKKLQGDVAEEFKWLNTILGDTSGWLKVYADAIDKANEAIGKFFDTIGQNPFDKLVLDTINSGKRQIDKYKEELKELESGVGKGVDTTEEQRLQAIKDKKKQIAEEQRKALDTERSAYKKREEAQRNFYSLKVKAMKDGLAKTLAQLDLEKNEEIRRARENAVNVGEAVLLINKMYNEKEYEAKRQWADEIRDLYINLEKDIYNLESEAYARQANMAKTRLEGMSKDWSKYLSSESLPNVLAERFTSPDYAVYEKMNSKEMVSTFKYRIEAINEYWRQRLDIESKNREKDYNAQMQLLEGEKRIAEEENEKVYQERKKNLIKSESETYKVLMDEVNAFYGATTLIEDDMRNSEKVIKAVYQALEDATYEYNDSIEESDAEAAQLRIQGLEKVKEAYEDTLKAIQLNNAEHTAKMIDIEDKYNDDVEKLAIERKNTQIQETKEAYDEMIKEKMGFLQYINSMDVIPDTNIFGILKMKDLKQMYSDQKVMYKDLLDSLLELRQKAADEWNKKDENGNHIGEIISQEQYDNTIKEINQLEASAQQGLNAVLDNSRNVLGEYIASINQYVQVFGQAIQDVMSMVWDMEDQNYDRMMEELDDYISKYEERRQKLEDITRQHAENINSIEDKLSTARGDRRENLIDQLNAEMELKRRSLAEEKKAEKEKEALEAKKDRLDKENKEKQKKRDLQAAIIAGALATAQGYATAPWIPMGVLQGSIAAALTAVQVALIRRTKYAEGGLIQGKSHAQGGIPVLGGTAEVEGNEFITNKKTTSQNLDVLTFINSKKRRLNVGDFIEFYGKPARAGVQRVTTKFANGGQLPSLRDDVDVADRLAAIVESYNQRPVYVSVVDINSKQAEVKNVQVLAGL